MKILNTKLTDEQLKILKDKGTEIPFTGTFVNHKDNGMYTCANCGSILFTSDSKFDSGSGWPSFNDIADVGAVKLLRDDSFGMHRTEVTCNSCGGHLGHVFDDAYQPTGKYYCINSCALGFSKK